MSLLTIEGVPGANDPRPPPPPLVLPASVFECRYAPSGHGIVDCVVVPKERARAAAFFTARSMVNLSVSLGGNTLHCEGRVIDWACGADLKAPVTFSVRILKTHRRPPTKQRQDCYNEV